MSSESLTDELFVDQAVSTAKFSEVAIATLLLYDIILCIEQESRLIWRSESRTPRITSRILYLYNRYMSILWNLLDILMPSSLPSTSCTVLGWVSIALGILPMLGPAVFTTLRVYALSGRNKALLGATLLLSFGPFLVNVATAYQDVPVNLPEPVGCTLSVTSSALVYVETVIISRTCLILADTIAAVVTWWYTRIPDRALTHISGRRSLTQTLQENGSIYFCALLSLNVVDVVLVMLSITTPLNGGYNYVLGFTDPISSILNSRFLLALYDTNARLARGGSMEGTSSSLSLRFNREHGVDSGTAPQGFISSLAGPINAIPDGLGPESLEPPREPSPEV